MRIRPLTEADLDWAEQLSDDAFYELDVATTPPHLPGPERRTPDHATEWIERSRSLVRTDPDGCWAAEDESGPVGFATSFRRELMWGLATFAVRPGLQGRGIGARLLDAASVGAAEVPYALLSASVDAKAVRRYRLAGFDLHPQMIMSDRVERSGLAAVAGVREGGPDDRELADRIDRTRRGGGHGPDHASLAGNGTMLVATSGRGYAYASPSRLHLLAALDDDTARILLCEALGRAGAEFTIPHVTAANQWALDIGMAARLDVSTSGFLALRGLTPPTSYIHNGALL